MPDSSRTVLNDCVLAFDQDSQKFLFISPEVIDVLGYDAADFHQNTFLLYEMIDQHYRDNVKEEVARLSDGARAELCYKIICPDGEVKWIYDKKSLITDKHSGHKVLLSIIRDSAPENTGYPEEAKLTKNVAAKLDVFIESITDSFFIINKQWQFVKVNTAFEKVCKKSRAEIVGNVIWDIFPGILATGFEEAYRKATAEKVKIQFTEYFEPLDMWFNTTVYPSPEGLMVFVKDITDEKHVQEELIWAKNNLEALINNTEDQIWSVDRESRYVYMNEAYRSKITRLTGIEPKEGDYSYSYVNKGSKLGIANWDQYYTRAIKGEIYSVITEVFDPVSEQMLSLEISFNPIFKSQNEVTGIGCYARNITERLKAQKAVIEQNERLMQIASLTSHELRRPVASMLGLISIMDRENFFNPDNREIIEHLLTVSNEIDEVIRLIVDKTFIDTLSIKYTSP